MQMESMPRRLLESCSLEEIERYVPALRDVQQALEQAVKQGTPSRKEVDMALSKWLTE